MCPVDGEWKCVRGAIRHPSNLLSRSAEGGPDPGQMDLFYEGGIWPLVERVETNPGGQGTIHDIVPDAMGNILDDEHFSLDY